MELSKGFNNLQRSTMKPYNQATTLLPPPAILQEVYYIYIYIYIR